MAELVNEIDSQALTKAFSFTKEKQRAVHGLKGILSGVVADKQLNKKELLFLDIWLKSQRFLFEDEDVVNILSQVGEILEDGLIAPDELDQLQESIQQVISNKDESLPKGVGQVDELMGFLSGVASDGVLNDQEVQALTSWLEHNGAICDAWPASVIVSRLSNILEDGIITEEERQDLMITVNQITGSDPKNSDISYESSTEVWEEDVDSIKVLDSTFCLTGDFVSGDRNAVDTMLRCMGAEISPNVNRSVDYLVIGTLASRDWLYTSHGRKIEKALLLKREGAPIVIITERTLLKHIR